LHQPKAEHHRPDQREQSEVEPCEGQRTRARL